MRVLTWNLYLGAALDPVFRLRGPADVPPTVAAMWEAVQASDPPGRLDRVAAEIAAAGADLIGLQEVARYAVSGEGGRTLDFLELLLAALRRQGAGYRVVVEQENFGAALPDPRGRVVSFADRDVVLAREDVPTSQAAAVRYVASAAVGPAALGFRVPRGFVRVRAGVGEEEVAFVNTHLEGGWFGDVQGRQAAELLAALGDESLPTVLVGDLNAGPGSATYRLLAQAGFEDAWTALRGDDRGGATCCHGSDLRGEGLGSRIDLVLHRGALRPTAVERVGVGASARTADGRWPSDHAGVVASLARRVVRMGA